MDTYYLVYDRIIFDVYPGLPHVLLIVHFNDITQKRICCSSMTVLLLVDNSSKRKSIAWHESMLLTNPLINLLVYK